MAFVPGLYTISERPDHKYGPSRHHDELDELVLDLWSLRECWRTASSEQSKQTAIAGALFAVSSKPWLGDSVPEWTKDFLTAPHPQHDSRSKPIPRHLPGSWWSSQSSDCTWSASHLPATRPVSHQPAPQPAGPQLISLHAYLLHASLQSASQPANQVVPQSIAVLASSGKPPRRKHGSHRCSSAPLPSCSSAPLPSAPEPSAVRPGSKSAAQWPPVPARISITENLSWTSHISNLFLFLFLSCTQASLCWTIRHPGTSLSWLPPVTDRDLRPPGVSASPLLSLVCMSSCLSLPLCVCLFLLPVSILLSSSVSVWPVLSSGLCGGEEVVWIRSYLVGNT
ncbi:uncharacterized protein LOC122876227 [Siniperca chuatsi]|uniref:uncharacterized protein LOC122876227 n=1 Tax=Siniperca chuatsi TaxID=119488 RepID=UPI001CE17DE9|nr:uncharacterized protein LOC122876227 [Siniperca chuatsi]